MELIRDPRDRRSNDGDVQRDAKDRRTKRDERQDERDPREIPRTVFRRGAKGRKRRLVRDGLRFLRPPRLVDERVGKAGGGLGHFEGGIQLLGLVVQAQGIDDKVGAGGGGVGDRREGGGL